MNKTRWIIFGAIIVVVLGGLIFLSRSKSSSVDVSNVDANSIVAASDQNGNIADHVFQDTKSDVIMIEYGDFQCPGCGSAHPNVKTLLAEYGEKISFVFRNFPLSSIHPNARAAAAAAEAAGLQGKYWEMHDTLFENQDDWKNLDAKQRTDVFKGYANGLQLDAGKFAEDLAGTAVTDKIAFDQALGNKVGVSATPTFFVDGKKLEGDAANGLLQGDLTAIKKLLDEKLDK